MTLTQSKTIFGLRYIVGGVKIDFSWRSVTNLSGWVLLSLGGGQPVFGGEFHLGGVVPPSP